MNKAEIKQIILEEIENAMNDMASNLNNRELVDPLATILSIPDTEDDDITPPGIEDMTPDPIFGPDPSYVEEMARPKETWVATPKLEALLQHFVGNGGVDGLVTAMERISNVLTKTQNVGFKSRAKKYQKRFFTDEAGNIDKAKLRQFAELLLNPSGFTQSDIQNFVGFKNSAQANAFKMKLYKAKLINVQQPQDDSEEVSESKKKLEFDFSQVETPEKLPIDVDEQDLMDNIKKELKSSAEDYSGDGDKETANQLKDAVNWVDKNSLKGKVTLEEVYKFLTEFHKQLPEDDKMFLHEPTILELIEDEFKPYVDTEKEYQEIVSSVKQYLSSKQPQTMNKIMNEISLDTVTAAISTAVERGETKRAEQLANTFFRNFVGKDFGEPLGALENIKLKANFEGNKAMGFVADFSNMRTRINYGADLDSLVYSQDGGAILDISKLPLDRKAVRNLQQIIKVVNPESKLTTGTSGFNVAGLREMTNLEKYIKQVIREAKNPLAQKMKEIENQGRVAALETKLAAIAEMIEETNARLTRIDEDEEFTEMMDKNAVKEVRKQLKELERAKDKLEKEKAKMEGKGMKRKEVVNKDQPLDENLENIPDDIPDDIDWEDIEPDAEDRPDYQEGTIYGTSDDGRRWKAHGYYTEFDSYQVIGDIEEVEPYSSLNESVKRMQKLAGVIKG